MKQKWYNKASVQTAIVSGFFLLIVTLIAGLFSYLRKSTDKEIILDSRRPKNPFNICNSNISPQINAKIYSKFLSDEEQIRLLIAAEAKAAVESNIHAHVSLFTLNATIANKKAGIHWRGCKEIVERDMALFSKTKFLTLTHEIKELDIQQNTATAVTFVQSKILDTPNRLDEYYYRGRTRVRTRTIGGEEEWSFLKGEDGFWRIDSLVYE